MAENLIHHLIPHQGCVITRTGDRITMAAPSLCAEVSITPLA